MLEGRFLKHCVLRRDPGDRHRIIDHSNSRPRQFGGDLILNLDLA
jgi:hypothetical protein